MDATKSPMVNFLDFLDNEKEKKRAVNNEKQLEMVTRQLEASQKANLLLKKENAKLKTRIKYLSLN